MVPPREQHERDFARGRLEDARERRLRRWPGARGPQIGERVRAGRRLAVHHDRAQRGALGRRRARERRVVELVGARGHEVRDRLRVPGEVRDLGPPVRGQHHHRYRADAQQREERGEKLQAVTELEEHALLRPQPELPQAGGELLRMREKFSARRAALAVDDRDARRRGRRGAPQHLEERDPFPVTLLAVAARELLGPGRAAGEHARARQARR